jgi:polyhydroxybutyrate depolymerase
MADWPDRDYFLYLPETSDAAPPLVLLIHGGGGKKESMNRGTCPDGDEDSPECFVAQANARGFVVVAPDGTSAGLDALRTWNAGGGVDDFRCVSGKACAEGVDDVAYFSALLDELARVANIDDERVYATGISNGGAMSYRLACDLADRITAIAPVGGGNQAEVSPGCTPSRAVPVLHHHGVADPCWKFEGGAPDCPTGQEGLVHISIPATIEGDDLFEGWVSKAGCVGDPATADLVDHPGESTTSRQTTWSTCTDGVEVALITTEGGGHTWPRGNPYFGEDTVGAVAQDLDLSRRMLDFFDRFSLP